MFTKHRVNSLDSRLLKVNADGHWVWVEVFFLTLGHDDLKQLFIHTLRRFTSESDRDPNLGRR